MKKIALILFVLVFTIFKFTPNLSAQNHVGPWIGDVDATGETYIWTSVYDDEKFWSLQISYSYYWGMMFAAHINGEYIKVWQPTFIFPGNYKVKPDKIEGNLNYLQTASQINKIIGQFDSGDCKITMNFYLNGEPKTKTFHYRYYPGTFGKAMDNLMNNEFD